MYEQLLWELLNEWQLMYGDVGAYDSDELVVCFNDRVEAVLRNVKKKERVTCGR